MRLAHELDRAKKMNVNWLMVARYVDGKYIAPSMYDPSVSIHAQRNSRHHLEKHRQNINGSGPLC